MIKFIKNIINEIRFWYHQSTSDIIHAGVNAYGLERMQRASAIPPTFGISHFYHWKVKPELSYMKFKIKKAIE